MPLLLVTSGARADILAQAIWCESNSTLYFDYCETVTDASGMFLDCDQLTTIYCNQTWSIANSSSMFENCRQLKGAVSYEIDFNTNDELANPINGYFTASLTLSDDASNADYLITYNECYGNITLNGNQSNNICNVVVTGAKGITFSDGGNGPARVAGNHFQDE